MGNFKDIYQMYWRYYLEIEKEYLNTGRYVELSELNYGTYSIEYLKLLLLICGEIDSIAGVICLKLRNINPKSIREWFPIIMEDIKISYIPTDYLNENKRIHIVDFCCKNNRLRQDIYPWKEIEETIGKNNHEPSWWTFYNAAKHHRTEKDKELQFYYTKANLKNVSYALAALYTLELYLLESTGTINDLQRMDEYSTVFYQKSRLSYEDSLAILNEKTQQDRD